MGTIEKTIPLIPEVPGIYMYFDSSGTVIYVGKAKNLKKRVSQYFLGKNALGYKTNFLIPEISKVKYKTTLTEFDAILLEAKLIKKYLPKYNTLARDDKSPIYLAITRHEELPSIKIIRQSSISDYSDAFIFGPFQSSQLVRMLLKEIRRAIPYCTQKTRNGKACFYSHIGLCIPCPSAITGVTDPIQRKKAALQYRTHIRMITEIFSGKSNRVIKVLEGKMMTLSQNEQFEEARTIRDTLINLRDMIFRNYDPMVFSSLGDVRGSLADKEIASFVQFLSNHYPSLARIDTIECYDISHTYGTFTVGSMVTFSHGFADTQKYRRFKIRHTKTPNDPKSMSEILSRRMRHNEWQLPDLIVVDGGKPQLSSAVDILYINGQWITPCIGLAKKMEEVILYTSEGFKTVRLPSNNAALRLLQRIRDESHRFAITYHKILRHNAYT